MVQKQAVEWEPRSDEYYYGDIPIHCTLLELRNIMKDGLIKIKREAEEHGEKVDPDWLSNVLDRWFEHDSNRENKFDYLLDDDDEIEQFFNICYEI